MIKLVYPGKKPSIKEEQNKELIFCIIRKKWVSLTPEEWVRQNFLLYISEVLNYPLSLVAVEKQLLLTDVKKRSDIVVYDRKAIPFMIVECKEMNVPLSANVLEQAMRYNSAIQARYLIITNGSYCAGYEMRENQFVEIESMPTFN